MVLLVLAVLRWNSLKAVSPGRGCYKGVATKKAKKNRRSLRGGHMKESKTVVSSILTPARCPKPSFPGESELSIEDRAIVDEMVPDLVGRESEPGFDADTLNQCHTAWLLGQRALEMAGKISQLGYATLELNQACAALCCEVEAAPSPSTAPRSAGLLYIASMRRLAVKVADVIDKIQERAEGSKQGDGDEKVCNSAGCV